MNRQLTIGPPSREDSSARIWQMLHHVNIRTAPRGAACKEPTSQDGPVIPSTSSMVQVWRELLAVKSPHNKILTHRLRVTLGCTNPGDSIEVPQRVALLSILLNGVKNLFSSGLMGTHLSRANYGSHLEKAVLPQGQPFFCSLVPQKARQRLRKAEKPFGADCHTTGRPRTISPSSSQSSVVTRTWAYGTPFGGRPEYHPRSVINWRFFHFDLPASASSTSSSSLRSGSAGPPGGPPQRQQQQRQLLPAHTGPSSRPWLPILHLSCA